MYKLYSGILARKLIRISKEKNWISFEQIGFLLGIGGIQVHTFVLESAIHEAKNKICLFLGWTSAMFFVLFRIHNSLDY